MSTLELAPLTDIEVRSLVERWFQKLDVHAPVEDLLEMVSADDRLEMHFPEAALHGKREFASWYEGVARKFFDEVHVLKELHVSLAAERATAQLVVNWQARTWNPPQPR